GSGGVPSVVNAGSVFAVSFRVTSFSSFIASIPYARVNECVRDVNQKVERQKHYGDKRNYADYQRLVAVLARLNQISSESWKSEDALDYDRACQKECERRAC